MSEETWRRSLRQRSGGNLALALVGGVLVLLFVLPVLALCSAALQEPIVQHVSDPFVLRAIWVSATSSGCAIVVILVLATPLAFVVSRVEGPLARGVEVLALTPLVLPPAVAGLGLLLALGRNGALYHAFSLPSLALTWSALVIAQVFVAAPFYFWSALSAFRSLDAELLRVLDAAGVAPWRVLFRVAIPVAWRPLLAGALLCWGRAVGEFGATLVFAGSIEGLTQTMPMGIYAATESDLGKAATLSVFMLCLAATLILAALRLGHLGAATNSGREGSR